MSTNHTQDASWILQYDFIVKDAKEHAMTIKAFDVSGVRKQTGKIPGQ